MSISNLFAPNQYTINAGTINVPLLDALTIDTPVLGQTLQIGPTNAGTIQIGKGGGQDTIIGNLSAQNMTITPGQLNAPFIVSPLPVTITSSAAAMIVGGNPGETQVTIGRAGELVQMLGNITYPGNGALTGLSITQTVNPIAITVNTSGAAIISATVRIMQFGSMVTIEIPATASAVTTAAAALTLPAVIPAALRPATADIYSSGVVVSGASVTSIGRVLINHTTGDITFTIDGAGTVFPTGAGAIAQIFGFQCTYIL